MESLVGELLQYWSTTIGALTAIGGLVATSFWAGYRFGLSRGRNAARADLLWRRHSRLYAPLMALFVTAHITSARAILAPYFGQRWRSAVELLRKGSLHAAWRALWDRRATKPSAEVEFGGSFPLSEIVSIVESNLKYADQRLVRLTRQADRAGYENHGHDNDTLTDEEYELFIHIASEYERHVAYVERYGRSTAAALPSGGS